MTDKVFDQREALHALGLFPSLHGQRRTDVDRMWRSPEKRKQFEGETGLSDGTTEEYHTRFIGWALALLTASPPANTSRGAEA